MTLRRALLLAAIALQPATARADALDEASAVFVAGLSSLSATGCAADLSLRTDRYRDPATGAVPEPLLDVLAAQALVCESLRRDKETGRRADRLGKIGRGGGIPSVDIDPDQTGFTGALGPGADLLPDANAEGLTPDQMRDRARVLLTAVGQRLDRLPAPEAEAVRLAIDAEARHSIFDRFRDLLPPPK